MINPRFNLQKKKNLQGEWHVLQQPIVPILW